jgi:PAS domain S-box-containing protein
LRSEQRAGLRDGVSVNPISRQATDGPAFESDGFSGDWLPALLWSPAADDVWWSEGMFALHGYEPLEVEPSLPLLFDHQHPDDRDRARQAFDRISRDGRPFVFEHRLLTRSGQLRTVILSVSALLDAAGRPATIKGMSLDVTDARRIHHAAAEETVSGTQAELSRITSQIESHNVVSKATGVLMERHKLPADEATALLRRASQLAGRKLGDIASELLFSGTLPPQATFDEHPPKPSSPKPQPPTL